MNNLGENCMAQIVGINIGTDRPAVLADFYGEVLKMKPTWHNDDIAEFVANDFRLEIMRHSEVSGKNKDGARLIFNFMVDDVPSEFDRIANLGAGVIQEPYEFDTDEARLSIATLTDPDGNYFQLISMETP
jgi:predicted enzyme related to lactoylglutathione lyase